MACSRYFITILLSTIYLCKGTIINKDVESTIDLRSHLVKISHKIIPDYISKNAESYLFTIPLAYCENLAYISVKDSLKRKLELKTKKSNQACGFLISNMSSVFYVDTIYSTLLEPHPRDILQSDKQLVKYSGNIYFFSPYMTKIQQTTIQLSSNNVLSYSHVKPVSVLSHVIKYGPFENVAEFSVTPLNIHFENQSPFLTVTYLERIIEVSHWGNVAVEENIHLIHSGAKLKGSFSRYELQKDIRSGQSAIKFYKTLLPAAATSVYYRDGNGNISTSNMKITVDAVELELRPRFSLFGGWKTNYVLGYNVPSFEYLFNRESNFLLKMRLIDHVYDDMIVNDATIKIILPEGSEHIELITPYPVSRKNDDIHYTYLDTIGRPVISFTKRNLVENHILDFYLKYTFSKTCMLHEPILVVAFVFVMFSIVIVFMRLDFSISKTHIHKE